MLSGPQGAGDRRFISLACVSLESQALKLIEDLKEQRKQRYVLAIYLAGIYAGLRDKNQAFAWIEECYEERSDGMTYLYVERLFDSLRSDPRFKAQLRRVGFSK